MVELDASDVDDIVVQRSKVDRINKSIHSLSQNNKCQYLATDDEYKDHITRKIEMSRMRGDSKYITV